MESRKSLTVHLVIALFLSISVTLMPVLADAQASVPSVGDSGYVYPSLRGTNQAGSPDPKPKVYGYVPPEETILVGNVNDTLSKFSLVMKAPLLSS